VSGSSVIDLEATQQRTPTGVKWQIPRHVPHFLREQLAGVDPNAQSISFLEVMFFFLKKKTCSNPIDTTLFLSVYNKY
jgi:hypothetical protein